MAPPDHKTHKYPPLRDDRGGARKGDVPHRDRDGWPAERADRSRVPPHLERRDGHPRDRMPYRDSDRRERPRPAPPLPMRRDRDDREMGEKPAEPQRRPPPSGRAQEARPAPEIRVPGLSVLGTGSNVMEELRRAAMARVKQAAAKPQEDDDMEEGEAEPGEMPSLKRPNPITWQTPPKKARIADAGDESPADSADVRQGREAGSVSASRAASLKQPQPSPAKGAAPLSTADRAARELEEFTMRSHADVDPHAPPAMKASPSVSGDDTDMPEAIAGENQSKPEIAAQEPEGPDEDMVDPPVKVPRSRWLDEEPEEEEPELLNKAELDEEAARAEQAERELNEREREGLADGGSPSGRPDDEAQGPGAMRSISMLQKCRDVRVFEKIRRISEGTYGVVYQARDRETGHMCALKKIKMDKEKDGFPQTSIREINILLSFHHPNIVEVSEVVVGERLSEIYMVMEYVEHDLKQLSESMKQPFSIAEVKCLMQQLFCGMHYLHENWVLHRDLKTSNILYSNRGELKICDFGLARQYGSPLRPYTHNVVTLWYRAPELLLGCKEYSTAIDMWSLGCIMAELLTKTVLFSEQSEIAQLQKIFAMLGTPSEENWPGSKGLKVMKQLTFKPQPLNRLREKFPAPSFHDEGSRGRLTEEGFKLLTGLLTLCPERRLTAAEALQSKWFTEHPPPKEQALMPTFPDKEAAKHISRPARKQPSPDPRLQPSASAIANRAAEVGTLFSKPGTSIS